MSAPFPYFGGKATVAPLVWERFGDVPNYVEPFFGSGAVLLSRPHDHLWWERTETINDKDGFVANFWRSVQHDPAAVAQCADWIVCENDLHARHAWLVNHGASIVARLEGDPDFYDAKVAGWWLWGICQWIGSGWCSGNGPWHVVDGQLVRSGNDGRGINRKLVHLGDDGRGINRKLVHLGNDGQCHCEAWSAHLREMMTALADRLRRVRVCSGDWSRVCGPTPTAGQGTTGIFLDPPYALEGRHDHLYRHEMPTAAAVREWAVAHGDDPAYRIAYCSYADEPCPEGWECIAWKARGGYGNQGNGAGRENAARERLWFSPHCLRPAAIPDLFSLHGIEAPA